MPSMLRGGVWMGNRKWRTECHCAVLMNMLLLQVIRGKCNSYPTPPLPLAPFPSASQLAFQQREMAMFIHFGMNTFTDSELGNGTVDPIHFNPSGLNAGQWISVAKLAGFKLVNLVVKHHDGFCLWQTKYSNYSVARSPWKSGNGDVLQDLVTAAKESGLRVGIYLSPWDRHEESYGDELLYNEHYLAQMREILTKYGYVSEVFLDEAKSADVEDMRYYSQDWFDVIKQLQPSANIFSEAGPDVRWVGNEDGSAGSTCWAMMNRSEIPPGKGGQHMDYLNKGDYYGTDWAPPECDVSIRPGWFWHASEGPWPVESLIDLYFKSVGRNCVLLLNVPPNSTGLISEEDIQVLVQFRKAVDEIFSINLAAGAIVTASSIRGENSVGVESCPFAPSQVLDENLETFWTPEDATASFLELDLKTVTKFNVLSIQETITFGQRVASFSFYSWVNDTWSLQFNGSTIGFKRLCRLPFVETTKVRLQFDSGRGPPLISFLGLYLDKLSVSHPRKIYMPRNTYYFGELARKAQDDGNPDSLELRREGRLLLVE